MRTATALICIALASSAVAAPTKGVKNTAAIASGAAYASSVAGVDCANVMQRVANLRPFLPLLRSAIDRREVEVERDEFETSDAHQERQAGHLKRLLGGTDQIVGVIPLQGYNFRYDADAGEMVVGGPFDEDLYHHGRDYNNRQVSLQLFRETVGEEHYQASNAYGATVEVERSDKIRLALLLGKGAVPKVPRSKLSVPDAKALKANPKLLIVGQLRSPYVSYSYDRSEATIDYPYETRLRSYALHVRLECAILTSDGKEFYRWAF